MYGNVTVCRAVHPPRHPALLPFPPLRSLTDPKRSPPWFHSEQPLSIASIGRFAWVNYKITDKRISVTNTSPVGNEDEKQLECPMEDVQDVVAIGRGLGIWGDMVIKLKDGSKIEIRSIDKWQEIRDFILSKVLALRDDNVKPVEAKPVGF